MAVNPHSSSSTDRKQKVSTKCFSRKNVHESPGEDLSFLTSATAVPTTESPFEQQLVLTQPSIPQPPSSPSLFTKICNTLIQTIWQNHKSSATSKTANSKGACPRTIQSRYGDDVVLRFKIKSEEEATAFTEATDLLYLDVWAATEDWVDLRISRKVQPWQHRPRSGRRLASRLAPW